MSCREKRSRNVVVPRIAQHFTSREAASARAFRRLGRNILGSSAWTVEKGVRNECWLIFTATSCCPPPSFRQPADPGNKTDETDLAAIARATINGFGLLESVPDELHEKLRLLARHRRDLVRKRAALNCQIREHLDAVLVRLRGDVQKAVGKQALAVRRGALRFRRSHRGRG